ncbi:hypothetical protein M0R45_027368 [Rubus argutus]|uniref:Uncharacterized protein n=1 Tax=Rubus argutus TaxID=59490 RepID=A0AAW1X2V1_RUBAR
MASMGRLGRDGSALSCAALMVAKRMTPAWVHGGGLCGFENRSATVLIAREQQLRATAERGCLRAWAHGDVFLLLSSFGFSSVLGFSLFDFRSLLLLLCFSRGLHLSYSSMWFQRAEQLMGA